jgi:hypothetical protein
MTFPINRPSPILLSILLLSFPPAPALPQGKPAADQASPAALRAHVRFLSDDALEGRGTGTRGGLIAAKYIAAQLERLGLEPAGDSGSYFQKITLLGRTPSPTLRVVAGDTTTLRYPDDYVLVPTTDDSLTRVTGGLVFAGHGVVAPNRGWDDYKRADVRGKIVLLLPGDPDSTRFDRLTGRPWTAVREKADEAARRGAAGVLVVHSAEEVGVPWSGILALTHERIGLPGRPGMVSYWGWITDRAAAALAAAAGQDLARLKEQARSRGFQPVPLGLALDAEIRTAIRRIETQNVVGRLPGTGPHAGEAVVAGAHYDHLGIGEPVNGDSIYNGAEDNASGTAAVLGAAEALAAGGARPGRSIVFAAFAAEELGLLGSEWLVAHPPAGAARLVGAIAMDVLNLYGPTRDIGTVGAAQSSLGRVIRHAAAAERMSTNEDPDDLRRGRFFRSDNYSFARAGIPTIRLVNGVDFVGRPPGWGREQREAYWNERYHRPNDELAGWMSTDGLAQQVRVLARALLAVANDPRPPTWAPGSDFRVLARAGR